MSDRPQILLVDSDLDAAQSRARLLAWGGFEPEVAGSTGDAVAGLLHGDYAAVVMNPAADDLDLDRILRAAPRKLPVIALSAEATRDAVVAAFRRGFSDWLDELTAPALAEALRRAQINRATAPTPAPAREPTPVPLLKTAEPERSSPFVEETPASVRDIAQMVRDGTIALPQMPEVVMALRDVLRGPDPKLTEVVRVLERDPAMVARVVSTANSAALGGRGNIRDVRGALVRLGMMRVRSLVETAAVAGMFPRNVRSVDAAIRRAWEAHVTSACIARALADGTGLVDPEEAYLLAMFRDVGELFLLGVLGDLGTDGELDAAGMSLVETWHPRFSAALLAKWGLDRRFRLVAQNHHLARFGGQPVDVSCLHLMHVAGHLASNLVAPLSGDPPAGPELDVSLRALSLSGRDVEALYARLPFLHQEAMGLAA
jgi:HD-like signal output (HDOD) protein/CheY-like chemotaxis protein